MFAIDKSVPKPIDNLRLAFGFPSQMLTYVCRVQKKIHSTLAIPSNVHTRKCKFRGVGE